MCVLNTYPFCILIFQFYTKCCLKSYLWLYIWQYVPFKKKCYEVRCINKNILNCSKCKPGLLTNFVIYLYIFLQLKFINGDWNLITEVYFFLFKCEVMVIDCLCFVMYRYIFIQSHHIFQIYFIVFHSFVLYLNCTLIWHIYALQHTFYECIVVYHV